MVHNSSMRGSISTWSFSILFPTLELRVGVGEAAEAGHHHARERPAHDYLSRRWRGLPAVAGGGASACPEDAMTTATYTRGLFNKRVTRGKVIKAQVTA